MVRVIFSLLLITIISQACVQSKARKIQVVTADEVKTNIQYNSDKKNEIQSKEDFKKSHLINAEDLLANNNIREGLDKLNKNSPIAIYFTSADNSHEAALILQDIGFKQIYILNGGIKKWASEK